MTAIRFQRVQSVSRWDRLRFFQPLPFSWRWPICAVIVRGWSYEVWWERR